MKTQNYKNHPRFVYLYHYVLLLMVVALTIATLVYYFQAMQSGTGMFSPGLGL